MKRVLIALGLMLFCIAVFAAVKAYGVWVITVVAVILFILGILRKDQPAGPERGEGVQNTEGEKDH